MSGYLHREYGQRPGMLYIIRTVMAYLDCRPYWFSKIFFRFPKKNRLKRILRYCLIQSHKIIIVWSTSDWVWFSLLGMVSRGLCVGQIGLTLNGHEIINPNVSIVHAKLTLTIPDQNSWFGLNVFECVVCGWECTGCGFVLCGPESSIKADYQKTRLQYKSTLSEGI